MRARSYHLVFLGGLLLVSPGIASAQKLDKDDKTFLDDVRPILLADEEKFFKDLKEKSDRLEFQKIFWARRDPDLATAANEYQVQFEKARDDADRLYRMPAQAGSLTDCGRTYILLGKPDEVQPQQPGNVAPGLRAPEVWVYKDKEGRTFVGGKTQIAFDEECRAAAALASQLDRIAAAHVVQPNLEYKKDKDGRIVKLADLLPKDSPARALLKQPRQDFPTAAPDGVPQGGGRRHGDARARCAATRRRSPSPKAPAERPSTSRSGRASWPRTARKRPGPSRPPLAPVGPDGAFVAGFKLALRPGKYTLKAGAVDIKGGKGSLSSTPIEVPDFSKVESAADGSVSKVPSAASLIIVKKIEELPGGTSDPKHPLAAFELGPLRLVPAFGGVAKQSEQVEFFYQVYDLKLDATTGKANATAVVSVYKDGSKTPIAQAPPNTIETEFAGSTVGPIPLTSFAPGKYLVQLKVTDKLGKKEVLQEASLEVTP